MFKDEVKGKLNIKSELLPFCLTMIGRDKTVVSGVKSVLTSSAESLRLRLLGEVIVIEGEGLCIAEIGGGDVYVKGKVGGVSFE